MILKNNFSNEWITLFLERMQKMLETTDIKLVTIDKRRKKLVSEANDHTTKWFSGKILAIEMKKITVKMNKPVYLGLSVLDISKTLMYEFSYDYIKPKCQDNAKICCMDTNRFIIHIKIEDFYEGIVNVVEKRYDTYNYEAGRPLPKWKNKKVIGLIENESKIITKFAGLVPKTYSYLIDDGNSKEKAKGT